MIFKVFNVSFIRLKHEHIEELRQWRNSDKIRMRMEYREHITVEMQENWFKQVNDIGKYLYFIIHFKGKNIGVIHAKDIIGNKPDGGMFFWEDECLNSHLPVLTSISFTDSSFYLLGNKETYCRMLSTNLHAIDFNKNFGYKLLEGQERIENQSYRLTREDYELKAPAIRSMLHKIYNNMDNAITIQIEREDYSNGVAEFITGYYQASLDKTAPVKFKLEHL